METRRAICSWLLRTAMRQSRGCTKYVPVFQHLEFLFGEYCGNCWRVGNRMKPEAEELVRIPLRQPLPQARHDIHQFGWRTAFRNRRIASYVLEIP